MTDSRPRHHGLTIEEYAVLSARLAEGMPRADLLAERGLSEDQWNAATFAWMNAMAADVRANGVEATLPQTFSDAFTVAQSALRPIPELTPEEWATLQYRAETSDREQAFAERGLRLADYLRLVRHWSSALANDENLADRWRHAFDAVRSRA